MITYGEVAYNAYCQTRKWKSVRGEPLPTFREQKSDLKESWELAAKAVLDYDLIVRTQSQYKS